MLGSDPDWWIHLLIFLGTLFLVMVLPGLIKEWLRERKKT